MYTTLLARGEADIFLTYCTNAIVVRDELPGALTFKDGSSRVFAEYDLAFKTDASPHGPPANGPVLVPTGRVGDRAFAVYAGPDEIKRAIGPGC